MHVSPTYPAMIPVLYSDQNGRILTPAQQNAPMRHCCIKIVTVFFSYLGMCMADLSAIHQGFDRPRMKACLLANIWRRIYGVENVSEFKNYVSLTYVLRSWTTLWTEESTTDFATINSSVDDKVSGASSRVAAVGITLAAVPVARSNL